MLYFWLGTVLIFCGYRVFFQNIYVVIGLVYDCSEIYKIRMVHEKEAEKNCFTPRDYQVSTNLLFRLLFRLNFWIRHARKM